MIHAPRDWISLLLLTSLTFSFTYHVVVGAKPQCLTPSETILNIIQDIYKRDSSYFVEESASEADGYSHNGKLMRENNLSSVTAFYSHIGAHSMKDSIIDVPLILSRSAQDQIYKSFNHLSWLSGTGVLGLDFYTDIKLSKFFVAYEDGVGTTTLYILMALMENMNEVEHYNKLETKNAMLNDEFYVSMKDKRAEFFVNVVGVDEQYLLVLKETLSKVNINNQVNITYIGEAGFADEAFMQTVIEKCEFFNFDHGDASGRYWPSMMTYYNFNKQLSFHHVGFMYGMIHASQLRCLAQDKYTVTVYPVVEVNKRFQNGALKVLYRDHKTLQFKQRVF